MDTQDSEPLSTAIRNLGQRQITHEEHMKHFQQELFDMDKRQGELLTLVSK